MNSLIAIIITSFFFIGSGWYLTHLLPDLQKTERLGLSFLLGAGVTTFLWFLLFLAGLPFNLPTLVLASAIEIVIAYQASKFFKSYPISYKQIKFTNVQRTLIFITIVSLLTAFLIGNHNPLTAWDSIALYDFRGHAIAMNHDLRDITDSSYYVSYPLMISLVHAIVYMLGGINAQGIHAIILASFVAVIYGRMKSWSNVNYALITCLLIIAQNEIFAHATFAYTNLPYLAYLVLGIIYAVSASKKLPTYLLFSGLLIGLSTWVRGTESFWIIGIIMILVQSWYIKRKLFGVFAIVILLFLRFTWTIYLNHILVSINYSYDETIRSFGLKNIERIISNWPEIYWYMRLNIFSPYLGIWSLTIPVGLAAVITKNSKIVMLTLAILLSASMVVVGIMVFSTFYTTWNQIGDSARRMILFMVPLSIIAATYAVYLVSNKESHD